MQKNATKINRNFSLIFFFQLFFIFYSQAQNSSYGRISGIVTDSQLHEPLMGATVQIEGTTLGTVADLDGRFELPNLTPGRYTLFVKYISYQTVKIEDVVVEKNKTIELNIEMIDQSQSLGGVEVLAFKKQNTEVALLSRVKEGLLVQSGISAQQIQKNQDTDATAVVRRIPGISILENKFVVVRGLSQRYNNVWINHCSVPSSEADSRAFSFDIIPASQLDNMMVVKSPSPELPADFTGGFIQIQTKEVSQQNSTTISLGGAVNDKTHFQDAYHTKTSPTDFLGFDNGLRTKNLSLNANDRLNNEDKEVVTNFTKNKLNNNWNIYKYKPIADLKLNLNLNRRYEWGDHKVFSLLGAVNYTRESKTYENMSNSRFGIFNIIQDKPEYLYSYTDQRYDQNTRLGAMLNLTFVPRMHDKYEFKQIFNQLGNNRYTSRLGFQNISSYYGQQKMEYLYASRSTYSSQFSGIHDRTNYTLDWNIGYAFANKNQPDRRIIELQEEDGHVYPNHKDEYQIDQNTIKRDFSLLNEHIVSGSLNYKYIFNFNEFSPYLKMGLFSEYRTRSFKNRQFYYRWNESALSSDFPFMNVVDEILQPANYDANKLYLYEDTDNRNSYSGTNLLGAGYVGLFLPLGSFDIYGGVRGEYNKMILKNYTTIYGTRTKNDTYDDLNFFPSVNLAYRINDKNVIRTAYGSSINRPEFREVSPSVYYDFDLFSDVKGNSDLKNAMIQNVDLRYEFYPSNSELIALTLFYKKFKNPIEWTYLDAGGSYTYTFENAKAANNYGFEIECMKNLKFMGLPAFSINLNATFINSKVLFEKGSLERNRAMQGQSPYILNAGLYYQNVKHEINAALLYNRIGKRIIGVGRVDTSYGGSINNDIPDSYEMARNVIDLSCSKKWSKIEVKALLKDLLAESIQFKQFPHYEKEGVVYERSQTTKSYKPGRTFQLSVAVNF